MAAGARGCKMDRISGPVAEVPRRPVFEPTGGHVMAHPNSFGALATLDVGGKSYRIWRLDALKDHGLDPSRLPYGLMILLENLLRTADVGAVRADAIRDPEGRSPAAEHSL